MIYAVIDTNVIVSALLADDTKRSVPFFIVSSVFNGTIKPVVSNEIIAEYVEVLGRKKFGFDKHKIIVFLSEFVKQSFSVEPEKSNIKLPDYKDLCFYDAAFSCQDLGAMLVTGNIKHFPDCPFAVTPSQFKEKLLL